ncbi:MAG: class I SAM-dependent methyltransferase, partial [Ignavibacteria bacterium]
MNELAPERDKWIRQNKYYYENIINFLKFNVPKGSKVIEIGSGTGYLLDKLEPSLGVGIDISQRMIDISRKNYPQYNFYHMNVNEILIEEIFDFVIISDTIGYFKDIQRSFNQIKKLCNEDTRIIITYINFLWLPVLNFAEFVKLKMPQVRNNWLDIPDISNLLYLNEYDLIKSGRKFLLPVYIPFISEFINRFIA